MHRWLMVSVFVLAAASGVQADEVENGDFRKDMANWQIAVPKAYGTVPSFAVRADALYFSRLQKVKPGYLTLNQAVNIRKDIRYRLSFDVKGEGGGRFLVTVQHADQKVHEVHISKLTELQTSWETVELEFTGKFDTDTKWVRAWRRATRRNELHETKGTPNRELHEIRQPKDDSVPSRSMLTFAVGGLDGSCSIRNVSLVEVE